GNTTFSRSLGDSSLCVCGLARSGGRIEWDSHADSCAVARRRMDHQLAAKEVHTLSHAHETEPLTILRFECEAHPGIGDLQLKTTARAAQLDERTLGGTVFDDVVEGLLHDAEYTGRRFSRNRHRHLGMH